MVKQIAIYDTATKRLEAHDPTKAAGIAIPCVSVSDTRPPTGILVGEGHYSPSTKHLSIWTNGGWLSAVPESLKIFPDLATMQADTLSAVGTPAVIASSGEMFIKVAQGWRSSTLRRYATITAANADTLAVDGSLGWLIDQQVMVYKDAGTWNRLVDTPHVTVSTTHPASPISGDINFNATTKHAEIYDGAAWVGIGGGVSVGSSAPSNAVEGAAWYRNTDGVLHVLSGGNWMAVTGKASMVSSAPLNPRTGQLWFNTTTKALMVWDSSAWVPASPATSSTTAPTTPKKGDMFYDEAKKALMYYDGAKWVNAAGPVLKLVAKKSVSTHHYAAGAWEVETFTIPNLTTYVPAGNMYKIEFTGQGFKYHSGNLYLRMQIQVPGVIDARAGHHRVEPNSDATSSNYIYQTVYGVSVTTQVVMNLWTHGSGGNNGDRQIWGNALVWDLGPAGDVANF